jgi:hypothetical protein
MTGKADGRKMEAEKLNGFSCLHFSAIPLSLVVAGKHL